MSESYKTDERILQSIKRNINCSSPEYTLKLMIYYKNLQTSLLLKNNERKNPDLKNTNVVYKFICPHEECFPRPNVNYIGVTTTSLSRRLTTQLAYGAIKQHMEKTHKSSLNRLQLTENTKLIKRNNHFNRLQIAEAVIIKTPNPTINRQDTGMIRTLKLFSDDKIEQQITESHFFP